MRKIIIPLLLGIIAFGLGGGSVNASESYLTHLPIVTRAGNVWLGPDGGRPVSMAIDPVNPNIVYAGSWGIGMLKSVDSGSTWTPINNGLGNMYINSLVIDPKQPQVLYAGTYRDAVYKTTDGGQSWFWSGTGIQAEAIVYTIAIDPQNTNNLYIGTRGISNNGMQPWNGVLYRSTNAGQSWTAVLQNIGGLEFQDWVYSIAVNPLAPNNVYAATHEHGVYRSENYGGYWFYSSENLEDKSGRAIVVDWKTPFPYRIYLGVWHGDAVYLSVDNGGAWELIGDGILGVAVYGMTMDPMDARTIYLSTFSIGILGSADAGASWHPIGLQTDDIYIVAVNPQDDAILYAGTAGDGLYRSLDKGATWQHSQAGFRNTDIISTVLPSTSQHIITALWGGGALESKDGGASWSEINSGLTDKWITQLVVDPARTNLIYALTNTGGLFRYDTLINSGWVFVGEDLPQSSGGVDAFGAEDPRASRETLLDEPAPGANLSEGLPEAEDLHSMAFAPSSPTIAYIATGGAGMYKSLNGGRDWFASGLDGLYVRSVAVDPANANIVYAVTSTGGYVRSSRDGGGSWSTLDLPIYIPGVYSVAVATDGTGALYLGTNLGVLRYTSTTGWNMTALGGISAPVLVTDLQHPGLIFAGTGNGAYYSTDSGATWQAGPDELAGLTVQSISFDPLQPQVVYFGTQTQGILQAALNLEP